MILLTFIVSVLVGAIQAGTSILYAAQGEVLVERSGVINLGLEGTMLMGASAGFMVMAQTGNGLLAVLAAALAGGLFNMILAWLVVNRGANQLASGLSLGFFGIGLSALLGKAYVGQRVTGMQSLPIPVLSEIPHLGRIFFDHDILTYLVIPLSIFLWWALFKTRWGLFLRSVGESKNVAFTAGLKPKRIQYQALFLGGLLAGIGGAHLSLAFAGSWAEGMVAGRGFIAVALVIFASWNPIRVIFGALLFGGAMAFQLQLQARGAPISPFLLDMIPYLLTLLVLLYIGNTRRSRNAMPQGLQSVFEGMS